MTNQN